MCLTMLFDACQQCLQFLRIYCLRLRVEQYDTSTIGPAEGLVDIVLLIAHTMALTSYVSVALWSFFQGMEQRS